jgi:hypothetical protein
MTLRLVATNLACAACFASAQAATVVVKPGDMNGWVTASIASGRSVFRNPAPPQEVGGTTHTGKGAWFGYGGCEPGGDFPGQAWLGTNQYAGVRLDRIRSFAYSTWLDDSGVWQVNGSGSRQLNPPTTPACLELLINTGTGEQRYLRVGLFGSKNNGRPGSIPESKGNKNDRHWKWWSVKGTVYWLEFKPTATPGVYDWADQTWDGIRSAYPNATIATSAAVGTNWPQFDTPTGCALNFVVGAHWANGNEGIDPSHQLASIWNNWWRDSMGARCYVDDFSMGVDNGSGVVTTTLFDFDANPSPWRTVNSRSARDTETCGIPFVDGWENGATQNAFVIVGRVAAEPAPAANSFYLDDGYRIIEVVCPGHSCNTPGQYWRAQGYLQTDFGFPDGDPEPFPPAVADVHPRMLCATSNLTLLWAP